MIKTALVNIRSTPSVEMTLEQILEELSRYGQPHVTMSDRGWWSAIDMHVSAKGATFNIRSASGHKSAWAAAAECLERVRQTLSEVGRE